MVHSDTLYDKVVFHLVNVTRGGRAEGGAIRLPSGYGALRNRLQGIGSEKLQIGGILTLPIGGVHVQCGPNILQVRFARC